MSKKIDSILEEILKGVSPNKEDLRVMEDELKKFLKELEKEIKKNKIDVKIFIKKRFMMLISF